MLYSVWQLMMDSNLSLSLFTYKASVGTFFIQYIRKNIRGEKDGWTGRKWSMRRKTATSPGPVSLLYVYNMHVSVDIHYVLHSGWYDDIRSYFLILWPRERERGNKNGATILSCYEEENVHVSHSLGYAILFWTSRAMCVSNRIWL